MLLTIVAIWAIVIPMLVLALSWQVAKVREDAALRAADSSASQHHRRAARTGAVPPCAVIPVRPRRTTTRRVCPEQARGVGRRPASA